MPIKAVYEKVDDIPENFRELFTERDGKHVIAVEGVKLESDITGLTSALDKERRLRREAEQKLTPYSQLGDLNDIQARLDRIPELEALAEGKGIDDNKINTIVETRIKSKLTPLERERDQFKTKYSEAEQIINQYRAKETQRTIHDAVRAEALKSKVVDTALEDVLMLAERQFEVTEDGKVITKDGASPSLWLTDMQKLRPHWWPASEGGGARGSGNAGGIPNNPWSKENWSLTAQGAYIKEHGVEKAERAAKNAGSYIGATSAPK